MKKYFKILLIYLLLSLNIVYAEDFYITSDNVILYNLNDNEVLYEQNSDEVTKVASLTKIMATIVAIENNDNLDEEVIITKDALQGIYEYTKVGFKVGDKVTVRDLLYGTMLPSGADAALALAIHTSGSVNSFIDLMNDKVKDLGLKNTSFDNPIGMDSENNYSTASDMADILLYALKNKDFETIFNAREYTITSINKTIKTTLFSYSKSYGLDTTDITGSKSGYTDDAGLCLASTASIDDVNYLLITLGADINNKSNAVRDTLEIYDYYSSNYSYQTIVDKDTILKTLPIKWGKTKSYNITMKEDLTLYLENNIRKNKITYKYNGVDEIDYKIKKGDKLGVVTILYRDKEIIEFDVYLEDTLKFYHPVLYSIIALSFIIMFLSLKALLRKKKRKKKKVIKK